jgi:hypothetical protein
MRILTGLRKTSRLLIYTWAIVATVILSGCGSRQAAAPSPSKTTTDAASSDPCAPTSANSDPCGSRLDFWVEKFSDFDEELSHATVVLGAPVPPHVLIREAIDPAAADDPFYAVEKLRSCSENLRFIGELPGGASSHPKDAASIATYAKACPKFEAAAAVFEEALKRATSRSSGFALMRTGQLLINHGEAVLCDGGIGCPKG